MFSATDLRALLDLHAPARTSGYLVGLSGGGDSAALLAAAAQLRDFRAIDRLRAVHVDHGLQPSAVEFRRHCAGICARFHVELSILEPREGIPPGESIEAFARKLRYAAIAASIKAGECLLTAHHREDQAETFLLQALRGAGLAGLAAMPVLKPLGHGWHLRPLLSVARADLRAFCRHERLSVCEDPMNADARFDRAFVRREVWPQLAARWPAAARALARAAGHVAEAQHRIDIESESDLARLRDGEALTLARLRVLPEARRVGALRHFIAGAGVRVPSTLRLREAMRQLCTAGPDRAPCADWDGVSLRRYRDRIYLTPSPLPSLSSNLDWRWRDNGSVCLSEPLGRVAIIDRPGGLDKSALPESIQIRPRGGGERLRPGREARLQTVQHLLQGRGVLPWMRSAIPFIFAGEHLLGVGDLWLNAQHCVDPGQMGVAFEWEHRLSLD